MLYLLMNKKTAISGLFAFIILALALYLGNVWNWGNGTSTDQNGKPDTTASVPSITYSNATYGFSLTLPATWKDYTARDSDIPFGTSVILRHPAWTTTTPRMDIPVLVYTAEQWAKWKANDFEGYPTAAPISPSERGHNSRYVFATAPRYNFSFATGWEEVEVIVQSLKGFDN